MKITIRNKVLLTAFLFLLGVGLLTSQGVLATDSCPLTSEAVGLSHDNASSYSSQTIKALQGILSLDAEVWSSGYHITGKLDWGTVGSLHRFQKKYHLPSTGVLDQATINKLCDIWKRGQQIKEQIQAGQIAEDPVSGTLTAGKNTVNPNELFTITVTAKDKQGVSRVNLYYGGAWHAKNCNKEVVCQRTFKLKESQGGIYNYYGFVVGYKLNGVKEGSRTIPIKAVVKVGMQNHLLYPQNNNNRELNRGGIQSQEENQGNYISGKAINLGGVTVENNKKPSIVNPSSKIYGNSGIPNKGNNFTMSNPSVSVTKNENGKYGINWFVSDAPKGPITVKIMDQNGKEVTEQTLMNEGGGVFFNKLNARLDPNKKYTFVISGGNKSGRFSFNGADLSKGAAIINNTVVTQYSTRNHYIYGISTGVSPDGKTMTVDLNISGAMGPAQTKNIKKLVVKDSNGKVIKTITGDWTVWGPILAGQKITIPGVNVTQTGSLSFELYDKNNNLLEKDQLAKDNQGGFVQLSNLFQGAQGWGSVYDPKVTYYAQGTPSGTYITLHFDAKGSGAVVLVHPDGTKEALKGSNATLKNMLKGQTGYLMFYDNTGKLTHIESIQRDSRGSYKNNPVDVPGVYYQKCGGGFYHIGGSGKSKILKITVNGKEVSLKGPSLGKSSQYPPGTKIAITFQDPNTEAIYATTYIIGSNHNIQSNNLINVKGANQPQAKPVSSTETKSGVKITGYSDKMNSGFAQLSGFSNLTIDKMTFGYGPHDSSWSYKQKIIEQFKKNGVLPKGDYYLKDKNTGKIVRVYVFQDGRVKILYDTTTPKSEQKIRVDKNGNSVIPIKKVENQNKKEKKEVNKVLDNYSPEVKNMINQLENDSYCKSHTCGISRSGYTVTRNPYTGKITIKGNEAKSTKQQPESKTKKPKTEKPKTEKSDNYEKTLNTMLKLHMISSATYKKKLEEHKKQRNQEEQKGKTTQGQKQEKGSTKENNPKQNKNTYGPNGEIPHSFKGNTKKPKTDETPSPTYGPGGEIPHSFKGNTKKSKTDETPSPTYGPGGEIPHNFLYRTPSSGSSNLFRDFLGFIFGVNTK